MEEIKKLAEPLIEYLSKNYNPHCVIVVSDTHVRVMATELSLPVSAGVQ